MARRRAQPEAREARDGGELLLPRALVERVRIRSERDHAASLAQHRARAQWFRDHGVDPADTNRVLAVLRASRLSYGIRTDALTVAMDHAEQTRRDRAGNRETE